MLRGAVSMTTRERCVVRWIVAGGALLGPMACGGSSPPPGVARPCGPAKVDVTLMASTALNPTEQGGARPVVARLLQLKSDARILQTPYERVWDEEQQGKALGTDVLSSVSEEAIFPGTRVDFLFRPIPEATSIAVIALFRQPTGRWVITFDLPEHHEGECLADATYDVWMDHGQLEPGDAHREQFPLATVSHRIGLGAETDGGAHASPAKTDEGAP